MDKICLTKYIRYRKQIAALVKTIFSVRLSANRFYEKQMFSIGLQLPSVDHIEQGNFFAGAIHLADINSLVSTPKQILYHHLTLAYFWNRICKS